MNKEPNELDELLKSMLTENTGRHILDSGGAYGRSWERNQNVDFDAQPEATLTITRYGDRIEYEPCIYIYHLLRQVLELDEWCDKFNAEDPGNWNADKYYGIDSEQECWLDDNGFRHHEGRTVNTYNEDTGYIHSQIMQFSELVRDGEFGDEYYVLLQIHGGCDVRGGYTDAKLFYVGDSDYDLYKLCCCDAGFGLELKDRDFSICWRHTELDIVDDDGLEVDPDDLNAKILRILEDGDKIKLLGDIYCDY